MPISHIGDMRMLFDGIPLGEMNTSMTINATAAWLLALYVALADEQGVPRTKLTGTTQNDIIKEYLSRGTYVFPPAPSMRLTKDVILFTTKEMPKWNPMNVCSYHLQEAGATPVQELAFALATAIGVLDAVKASGECADGRIRRGGRAHLVLRQCRAALRHRSLQDARLHRTVGRDHARALRRHRSEAAAVPLRRAGQLARPDRAAAGEQRRPHPARNAGGDAVEGRPRARRAASGLERGARPAAAVGPAMVAAHAADPRLRDRPSGIRRHFRRLAGHRRQGRGTEESGEGRAPADRSRWAARSPPSNPAISSSNWSNRIRAASKRSSAASRPWSASTASSKPKPSPLADAADAVLTVSEEAEIGQIARLTAWRAARDNEAVAAALDSFAPGGARPAPTSCRRRSPAPKPASPPANGASRCAPRSANTARRPASAPPCATTPKGSTTSAPKSTAFRRSSAGA